MKTKEELKKAKAEWFQKNKQAIYERRKEYFKQWREKNKDKWNGYSAEWYAANKERKLAVGQEWERHHTEERRAYNKHWKDENKEKIAEQQWNRLLKYKTMVVEAYGGGCSCCGEKEIGFLTVEHIHKNGKEHRKEVGGNFYYSLVKNGFPKDAGLSILCMNCNWYERKGRFCPHKKSASTSVVVEPIS